MSTIHINDHILNLTQSLWY